MLAKDQCLLSYVVDLEERVIAEVIDAKKINALFQEGVRPSQTHHDQATLHLLELLVLPAKE